ncbi:efflux RND transporter periplasmic adaptor subunit [Spirochaetota bacterium]
MERTAIVPKVKTETVMEKKLSDKIYVLGSVSFFEKTAVSSKVIGRVEKLYARLGDAVEAGEKLAEIEKLQLEIEYKKIKASIIQAEAALKLTEAKYNNACKQVEINILSIDKAKNEIEATEVRLRNIIRIYSNNLALLKEGGVTQDKVENIKTEYVQAEIDLKQAEKDLAIQSKGYTDSDIAEEGYELPPGDKERLDIIKKMNTKIERAEVESAKANIEAAKLMKESVIIMLKESTVRALKSGIIAARNIEVGEEVRKDVPIYVILETERVHIIVSVNEKDFKRVKKGQRVEYTIDAFPSKKFTGSIDIINPVADIQTRSIECRILSYNRGNLLKPGMFARCHIFTEEKEKAIMIPTASLVTKDGNEGEVYVVLSGTAYKKKVMLGREMEEEVEVSSGLKSGEEIVVEGMELLQDKMKVRRAEE